MSDEGRRGPRVVYVMLLAVVAAAAGVLAWAVAATVGFVGTAPSQFWALVLAALLVDLPLFGFTDREDWRIRSTLSVCFTFAIFVVWGAGPAIVVQALAGVVTAIGQRYDPRAGLYLISRVVLGIAAAELVMVLADLRRINGQGSALTGIELLTFMLLAVVWFAVNYGLLVVARSTVRPGGLRQAVADVRSDLATTGVVVLAVAPLLTVVPGWWTLLVAVPLLLWNQLRREQQRSDERMGRDPECGLLNRQGLVRGMRAVTGRDFVAPYGPRPFGLIVVNVESVLEINRTLGRELYEKVVGVASRRLVDAYGEDRTARLTAEGIVIFVPDLTEPEAMAATEAAVALLEPRIEVDDIPFALDPAGGVALSPQHGRDLGSLLMKAELAASEARHSHRRAAVYVHQTAEQGQRRITLLRELHAVLRDPARHHELTVLYQPQVEIATGRLVAVEALLRWTHPQWGRIPTDELIEAIEPSEIMFIVTRHVLTTVAAQMRRWQEQGSGLRVSVNISVRDLHEPEFVAELAELIRHYTIPPQHLFIEITERMLISDLEWAVHVARQLAEHGVALSLDDFGTGYASLQQLRQLPLTEVKVDQSFVKGMVDNAADRAIVTSVHQLAQALGVNVVAEGVEDQRVADALVTLPGTIGQGWYFGRPMTVEALEEWRRTHPAQPARPTPATVMDRAKS